ncbi:3'(2'),5'-bisphosphate nucleotidase CysQ [Campylobacter sp. MIT 21-1685]|uniref:3'(2'),5'-bisphosphate nucleotidase CysQ family protein n=1 Tax=unclassified Campylobacter TaxID=2593542 RepID=UPI00224A8E7C|nr:MULTISPECIES: inositol monophosphatase family protein [unclassified Campylobacter]MCX2683051.1 3'(2'),5'-bisphosphate nucleotidase CysQ [Campylobacter sp. MIT 21-1684]MCX2751333.1 3'(2'),5'-bisphosphate nucleotidase CysQ [Campylobacter sp. MIT 21-1682]MCX2807532.1 3'(2'),5'-bisphosphate nucleotidase CysQ [Campylobacter sp. MIT 21-1685]
MNLDSCLNLAIKAANEASKAILNERIQLQTWKKDDGSVLSSADLLANEILTEILQASGYKVFSEEKILSFQERKHLEYFWLIDPLDGTSGFVKNSNEFCVMISLIHKNRPVLALIKNPTNGDIFYAHKETKVYKNDQSLNVEKSKFEKNKFKALLSVNHLSKEESEFVQHYKLQAINKSSGLKFCTLLEGEAGVYKRFQNLSIWDIAAGDFLVNHNGGFVGDFQGKMIDYNAKEHKAPLFLCVAQKAFLLEFL